MENKRAFYTDKNTSDRLKNIYQGIVGYSVKPQSWRRIIWEVRRVSNSQPGEDDFVRCLWYRAKSIKARRSLGYPSASIEIIKSQAINLVEKTKSETANSFTFDLIKLLKIDPPVSTAYGFYEPYKHDHRLQPEEKMAIAIKVCLWKLNKKEGIQKWQG